MTTNTVPANNPVRVWICPPTAMDATGHTVQPSGTVAGYAFPFSGAASWSLYPGLIPDQSAATLSSLGAASLRLLRQQRMETSDNATTTYPALVEGSWVAIDCGTGSLSFSGGNLLWCGWITRIDGTQVAGTTDILGTVEARELGDFLDQQQVLGWGKIQSGLSTVPTTMQNPPTANLDSPAGQVIGNCLQSSNAGAWPAGANSWAFSYLPADMGYAYPANDGTGNYTGDTSKYWTRWRLLCHAISYCRAPSAPSMQIVCADGSQAVDPGTNPTATATIDGGVVTAINPGTTGGTYTSPPTISITGGGGSGATATGVLSNGATGTLIGYTITNPGSGYTSAPSVGISAPSMGIAGYLNLTTQPEVYDLRNLTWRGMLDMLIPRERGLGWRIVPVEGANGHALWQINIYTSAATSSYGVPASTTTATVDATAQPIESIRITKDARDLPDKVIIEGSPCTFTFTVAYNDGNIDYGWNTGTPQTSYFTAASTLSGYSGLTFQQKIEQNRLYRAQGWLRDMFARFVLKAANGSLKIASTPGVGNSAAMTACPQIVWSTTNKALTISTSVDSTPYLGSSVILRTLCVPYGVKSDGTDQRIQQQKTQPQYIPLRAFSYDSTQSTGLQWRDLTLASPLWGSAVAQVTPDDRGAAVRVEFSPRELLAKGIWNDSVAVAADVSPNTDVNAINPNNLVLTITMESDQKLQVSYRRPGVGIQDGSGNDSGSDANVRRILKIVLPRLRSDGIWQNTIIGLAGATGVDSPDRWSGTGIGTGTHLSLLRNDWGIADKYAQQAAAWAFRPRVAVEITALAPTAMPAYASIGTLITSVQELAATNSQAATSLTVNTMVESVAITYGDRPRIVTRTALPPPPMFAGGSVSASPSGGGATSLAAGGTPTQATQAMAERVQDLEQKTQRVPLIIGQPYQLPSYVVQIVGGQLISGTVPVIQYAADPLTIPSAYNAQTATSTVAGIGIGYLYSPAGLNVGKVLVRHNFAAVTDPVMAGNVYNVGSPVSVPVSGGGAVQAYPILSVGG